MYVLYSRNLCNQSEEVYGHVFSEVAFKTDMNVYQIPLQKKSSRRSWIVTEEAPHSQKLIFLSGSANHKTPDSQYTIKIIY